jgi:Holliday junction resolvase
MGSSTLRTGIGGREKPRKARGGASPYRKGAVAERRAKKALEADGWFVIRSPQSGSAIDLLCVKGQSTHPLSWLQWVQVKSRGYLAPTEREAVVALADKYGGDAVLAWIEKNTLKRRWLKTGEMLEDLPCPC